MNSGSEDHLWAASEVRRHCDVPARIVARSWYSYEPMLLFYFIFKKTIITKRFQGVDKDFFFEFKLERRNQQEFYELTMKRSLQRDEVITRMMDKKYCNLFIKYTERPTIALWFCGCNIMA